MGIILGALGGAGGQLADYADKQIAQDQKLEAMGMEGNLALQRAKALEEFKLNMVNQQRQQMVARVDNAAGQIADAKLAPKVAAEKAGITDPGSWTPEQQAAVDQSNALDRQSIIAQAKADGTAGLASGDISPEKAMENTSKLQINQLKMDNLLARAEDRSATMKEIAEVRAESTRYSNELRLQASQEKRMSGKIDTATGRMLITSEDANIKASTNQMQMLARELESTPRVQNGKPHPRIAQIQQQMEEMRQDIETSKASKQAYLRSMGLAGTGADASTASRPGAAPTVNGAPYTEGTKLTGPDGKPYIVQGGVPVPVQ